MIIYNYLLRLESFEDTRTLLVILIFSSHLNISRIGLSYRIMKPLHCQCRMEHSQVRVLLNISHIAHLLCGHCQLYFHHSSSLQIPPDVICVLVTFHFVPLELFPISLFAYLKLVYPFSESSLVVFSSLDDGLRIILVGGS